MQLRLTGGFYERNQQKDTSVFGVNEGDKIKKGTPIVSFDIDKIKAAGYDTTVSVIISNTADFAEVTGVPAEKADLTRVVIKAVK